MHPESSPQSPSVMDGVVDFQRQGLKSRHPPASASEVRMARRHHSTRFTVCDLMGGAFGGSEGSEGSEKGLFWTVADWSMFSC